MRKIFIIALSLFSIYTYGQGPNFTAITVPVDGSGTLYNAGLILPNTYSTDPAGTKYPLLIFLHGQGEQGSSLSVIYTASTAGGPAWFNAQNQWPTSFTNLVDGKTYKYIVVYPQAPNGAISASTNAQQLEFVVDYLYAHYNIDTSRLYITGLSAGGGGTLNYPTNIWTDCSKLISKHKVAAIVPMSADFNAGCMQAMGDTLAARKIGLWGFGDPVNDTHGANTSGIVYYANQWIAGSGRFTSYSGGHCCWNQFYDPAHRETFSGFTRSIYEWLLSYSTATASTAPIVNPGQAQTLYLPTYNYTYLSGSATSGAGHTILSYSWTKVSGPNCYILNSASQQTVVNGLLSPGNYVFKLTATDEAGQQGSAQVAITVIAPALTFINGEYLNAVVKNATGQAYAAGAPVGIGSNTPHLGFAMPYVFNAPNANPHIVGGSFGLHSGLLLSDTGNVYACSSDNGNAQLGNGTTIGTSSNMFVQVPTDTFGNPFTKVVGVRTGSSNFTGSPYFGTVNYAWKNDGTLWVWGQTMGGYAGDSTYGRIITRPVQVKFPAGIFIMKVVFQEVAEAIDSAGGVWTWAGDVSATNQHGFNMGDKTRTSANSLYPMKVNLPARVIDIAGASKYTMALLSNNQLWGWGFWTGYLGMGANPSAGAPDFNNSAGVPFRVDTDLGLPPGLTIKRISTGGITNYAILSNGSLWAWGGNECGQVGNGVELDFPRYTINPAPYGGTTSFPYNWNQDASTVQLQQHKPVEVTPGKRNWMDVSEGVSAVLYKQAVDSTGRPFGTGRGKTGMLANGRYECDAVQGGIGTNYPNALDVTLWTPMDSLFTGDTTIYMTCPICKVSMSNAACSNCASPSPIGPHAVAPNKSAPVTGPAILDGRSSTDNRRIVTYRWTQLSGPTATLMGIRSQPTDTVTNLAQGTYTFQLKVTDADWNVDSTLMTLTVATAAPNVSAGPDIATSLPVSSVSLVGSASGNSGATIASVQWTQVGGPNAATITSPTSTAAAVTNLVQGVYVFKLIATDSNGLTSSATMTLTAGSCNCLNFKIPTKIK
jgi:alpha-tubulin suppressor-like RCC1 family protein